MKRFLTMLLAFCALTFAVLGLCACSHEHDWGAWSEVTAATCKAEGVRERVCNDCGEKQTESIEKLPHTFGEWAVEKEATCYAEGEQSRVCSACNYEDKQTIKKLPHTVVIDNKVDPTCSQEGLTEGSHCGVCAQVLVKQVKIKKLPHSYTDWNIVNASTCTTEGLKNRTCSVCGDVDEQPVDKLPHEYGDWQITKEPTCYAEGTQQRECSVCRHKETGVAAKKPHDFGAYTFSGDRGASGHNGTHTRTCQTANCGYVETEACVYSTVNHPAKCDEQGYNVHKCLRCNDEFEHDFVAETGHRWSNSATHIQKEGKDYHVIVCLNDSTHTKEEACGKEKVSYYKAICTESSYTTFRCNVCLNETIENEPPVGEHSFTGWTRMNVVVNGKYRHRRVCQKCGYAEQRECNIERETKDATCTTPAIAHSYCTECDYDESAPLGGIMGHRFTAWQHEVKDGKDIHYRECQVCERREEGECNKVSSNTVATCQNPGQEVIFCETCHHEFSSVQFDQLDHDWGDGWKPDPDGIHHSRQCVKCNTTEQDACEMAMVSRSEANCTDAGEQVDKCGTCNREKTTVIEALGHLYSENAQDWNITETQHTRNCLRGECGYNETVNHTFNKSNLCDECKYDALKYELKDGGYWVSDDNVSFNGSGNDGLLSKATDIVIPSMHNGTPVIGIKTRAFERNRVMTSLTLPATLITIEDYAFSACANLKTVTVAGDGVPALKTIGNYAFQSCGELLSAENLPSSLQTIGTGAFQHCSKLAKISVPATVLDIGDNAFEGTAYKNDPSNWGGEDVLYIGVHLISANKTLAGAYEVRQGTVSISTKAFKDCTLLTKLTLPAELKEIDVDAFDGCVALQEVVYKGKFAEWLAIQFDNDKASPMHYASILTIEGAEGKIEIPDGITSIPAGAFKGSGVQEVVLPESVTSIGAEAFKDCAELTKITVKGKLTYVGKDAFKGCGYYLDPQNWTDGGKTLYVGGAFIEARVGTVQVTIQAGTTCVAVAAFAPCADTLTFLSVPESVSYIGEGSFDENSALSALHFEKNDGWFATSTRLGGVGRFKGKDLLADAAGAAREMKLYNGYWRWTA